VSQPNIGAWGPTAPRLKLMAVAVGFAVIDPTTKPWAATQLANRSIEADPLTYNFGVSFSPGSSSPAWIVVTLTGLVTAAVAAVAWKVAPRLATIPRWKSDRFPPHRLVANIQPSRQPSQPRSAWTSAGGSPSTAKSHRR